MDKGILDRNIQLALPDAEIVETLLPLCPQISLYLIRADNMKRNFSPHEIQVIHHRTPYWSFCWGSGQAMAYFILRNRALFEGRSVLDFGSGSGVVAISAAVAGARKVVACDSDRDAIDAIKANTALNRVRVLACESLSELSRDFDILTAADVLYDPANYPLLEEFLAYAPEVLVADSRLKAIRAAPYRKIAEITTTTIPDLHEGDEFNHVTIYRASLSTPLPDSGSGGNTIGRDEILW